MSSRAVDAPPSSSSSRTTGGHRRRGSESIDEASVAAESASVVSSFSDMIEASTSTVVSWWNYHGGIECTVSTRATLDRLPDPEGLVAANHHHGRRNRPANSNTSILDLENIVDVDDSSEDSSENDASEESSETNATQQAIATQPRLAQQQQTPQRMQGSRSSSHVDSNAKSESIHNALSYSWESQQKSQQVHHRHVSGRHDDHPSVSSNSDVPSRVTILTAHLEPQGDKAVHVEEHQQVKYKPTASSITDSTDNATDTSSKSASREYDHDEKEQQVKYKSVASSITASTANASDTSSISSSSSSSLSEAMSKYGRRWADKWEAFVKRNGNVIARILTGLARQAAKNPYICIFSLAIIALVMPAVGFATNFNLVLENEYLWPPNESFSVHQAHWLYERTKFTYDFRNLDMVIHADGEDVLTREGVSRVFDALSVIREMEDYKEGCKWADIVGDVFRVGECHIHSVAAFWNSSKEIFQQESLSDWEVRNVLSAKKYPSGQAVNLPRVIGNGETDSEGTLIHAQSFLIEFDLPWSNDTETADFEWDALEEILELQSQWKAEENNPFRLEVVAYRSYEDEFLRAIWLDLPLLPIAFTIVCAFCCIVFWRYDKVHSRTLLGIGAVVTILLSIMTSFGLMFLCGVPFTTSTTMLPFLIFGIGLDDSFIIIGSYNRTHGTNILKRIEWAMKDVSVSICITTLTSAFAFALGCFSDIPSVRWLCIYACPSILIDFFFQITFFIALIVLDERRIQDNRRDCCFCIQENYSDDEEHLEASSWRTPTPPSQTTHWTDRFMGWYADKLLRPIPQAIVLVCFFALLAGSLIGVLHLEQHFDMNDMVPQDSYLRTYYSSIRHFSKTRNGIPSYAFFRDMDQSDTEVQHQMLRFVDDLAEAGAIAAPPTHFWLRDFLQFTNESDLALNPNATFSEQVETFLKQPLYNELYGDHINRDANGDINGSRVEIYINVDVSDAKGGIAELEHLRNISRSQPINEGLSGDDWKMFTYQDMYNLWEFYMAVLSELSLSTIIGVVAVCVVGLLLVPHWSAVFFVGPMIVCLYVELLGYISYTHVNVNAISYVQLVMSIGLMVDFIMHILMRYYECKGTRKERVKETLQTMGSSIFVGGVSSLLGVSLLFFSTSEILQLVFITVLGLVVLGILHGLVFLPVILSLIGPV